MAFLPGVPALSPVGVERKAAGTVSVWLRPSRTSLFQHAPSRSGHPDAQAALPMPPAGWDISAGTYQGCLIKSNTAKPFLPHGQFGPIGSLFPKAAE